MTHTPGPWRYEESTKTVRSEPANYWLATMDSWDGAVDHKANARLIAAAPDLLKAAKALVRLWEAQAIVGTSPSADVWNAVDMACDRARTAIAKAEGRQP